MLNAIMDLFVYAPILGKKSSLPNSQENNYLEFAQVNDLRLTLRICAPPVPQTSTLDAGKEAVLMVTAVESVVIGMIEEQ